MIKNDREKLRELLKKVGREPTEEELDDMMEELEIAASEPNELDLEDEENSWGNLEDWHNYDDEN